MIKWIVSAALRFSRLVVAAAIGILGVALFQLHSAAVDVYPEFEPPDIQIQAEALGLSAQEVEQLITVPLEQDLLNGIPWVEHIRSRSMPGLSAIDLQFEPGTDLLAARQLTQERMSQAKALPNVGTPPIMVQPTSSTSRIAMIAMRSDDVSEVQMSVLARWIIKPRLMSIPGVANVSVWGMRDRQLQVQVDPVRLQARKVSLTQLIESTGNALWVSPLSFVEASTPGTGGFVETPNQRLGVQHIQPITTPDQLANVAVEGTQSPTLRIGDVANVIEDHQPLIGDASLDGAPSLMLVVERFPDANTAQVTRDVDEALDAMAPGLAGIDMDANVFRPASYMTTALRHLGVAGLVGAALFVAAVGLLFVSWRAVLIPVVAVPLSLVSAAWVLHLRGETLTTMTLLGLAAATAAVVDDVIGDVAAIRSRQLTLGPDRLQLSTVMGDLVTARRGPLLVASVVAILALAPVLAIGGVWNAFSWPFAATYVLAIVTSLLVALILTPALAVLLLRDGQQELRAGPLDRLVRSAADRVAPAIGRPGWVGFALGVLAVASILGATLAPGGPVLPTLQDRNVLVRVQGAPGTSLTEMNRITSTVATELRGAPGIESAGAHVGRAITSDEIVDVNAGEIWLTVAPGADYDATLAGVRDIAAGYPGLQTSVRTYAEDRVAAVREKVGDELVVRVYGADFATLQDTADDVASMLSTVSGVLTPRVEPQVTEPTLEIEVDLAAAQRHGLRPGDVRREATTLISGLAVGSLFEEQKVFDVVVWGGPGIRQSLSDLEALRIDTPSGAQVRLGEVAKVRIAPDPAAIDHNSVSRSLDVTAVVNGRSPADVSQEVTSRLRGISFPYEYRAEVLGDAVQQQADHRRVAAIAAVVVLLSFLILQAATGSWGLAAALLVTLPVAVTGGVLVAPLVGGVRSIGVLVALFTLLALAMRQALVFVRRARELGEEPGASPDQAVRQAVREVAPSVVGVALVMAALLVAPAVMGTTAGLEVFHPFAVSMLAGLVTATAVTLIAVPAFYLAIADRALLKEKGRPAATSTVPGFETEVNS